MPLGDVAVVEFRRPKKCDFSLFLRRFARGKTFFSPLLSAAMLEALLGQAATTVGLQLLTSPALADATR
jgi:hypothetical protein